MRETAVWWIRRDLRLADNPALAAAVGNGRAVIPLFVLDDRLFNDHTAPKRAAFLLDGLRALDADLRARGSRLVVRSGPPEQVVPQVAAECEATAVYAQEDVSPFSRRRDTAVAATAPLHLTHGLTVYPFDLIHKKDGKPYTVFTPFSKVWRALLLPQHRDLLPAPERLATPAGILSHPLPPVPATTRFFPPGEREARQRLAVFAEAAIFGYADGRHQLDVDGTSRLSPYLRFGMVSARETAVTALEVRAAAPSLEGQKGADTWLNELIWREFYIAILSHFPHVLAGSFRQKYDTIPWRNDRDAFAAWCAGQTGYPVVDAAMQQLKEMGWMHNRARMIVASFLVKDLLIDWRWGARWFMQHLVDGDPAANNGGWQWSAGTGTDAAPYFRIFNPTTQGKKFDPHGIYIRRWLPALAHVPDKFIHEPQLMGTAVQRQNGCIIGQDYPAPIVDRHAARERTLAAYKSISAS